jgi:hypothetical protein
LQLVASTTIEANLPAVYKNLILLGASLPSHFLLPPLSFIAEPFQMKGHEVSSLARISYGAQELAVFLLADSPSDF